MEMKKLLGICIMVLVLCAFSIPSANAQGPWCLDFSPSGVCDKMELARDANLNLYGHWDSACDGSFITIVQGSAISGVNNVVGETSGNSFQFIFGVPSARNMNLWIYDGVSPPVLSFPDQVWQISPGQCPNSAAEADLPSFVDLMD
jgi:hypothetical protein